MTEVRRRAGVALGLQRRVEQDDWETITEELGTCPDNLGTCPDRPLLVRAQDLEMRGTCYYLPARREAGPPGAALRRRRDVMSDLPSPPPGTSEQTLAAEYSPNQLDKRRRIIEAAKTLLLREGRRGCSTRAIARETGFSGGQIHYYFTSVTEIVDAAMTESLNEILERVRSVERHEDSSQWLSAIVTAHLSLFLEVPGLSLIWLEYLTDAVRSGTPDAMIAVYDRLLDVFTEGIQQTGMPDSRTRAATLLECSIGMVIGNELRPRSLEQLRDNVLSLIGAKD